MSRYTPLFYAIKSDLGIPKKLISYDDELFSKINSALSDIDKGNYQMKSKEDIDVVEALETAGIIYEAYHYILSSMIIELNYDAPPIKNVIMYSDSIIEEKEGYRTAIQNILNNQEK